jgi:NIMA-interacting peptidyl-prolyl cis-trans isomerase 4
LHLKHFISTQAKHANFNVTMAPSKLKPATSINVRHILCEKHSNKEKALAAIISGRKFDDVAREMSEDKSRQGTFRSSARSNHLHIY